LRGGEALLLLLLVDWLLLLLLLMLQLCRVHLRGALLLRAVISRDPLADVVAAAAATFCRVRVSGGSS
jgi:hypothetical protein